MMISWDDYRATYENMSYQEQLSFYDDVWQQYPVQHHYDGAACERFLRILSPPPDDIIEVGGWQGELASEMLSKFSEIQSWHNIEICHGAVTNSLCNDPRYTAEVPSRWLWEIAYPTRKVLIAAHVIEHMNEKQLSLLLSALRPRAAFVQSPLTEDGQNWAGYVGSHVLKLGWKDVISLFGKHGLVYDATLDAPDVRCFR